MVILCKKRGENMKKVKTKSYCLPTETIKRIDDIAEELGISASSVATAMLSVVLKWDLERLIKDGIQGRRA